MKITFAKGAIEELQVDNSLQSGYIAFRRSGYCDNWVVWPDGRIAFDRYYGSVSYERYCKMIKAAIRKAKRQTS